MTSSAPTTLSPSASRGRWRRHPYILGLIALELVLALLAGFGLWQLREQTVAGAMNEMASLLRVLAENTQRSLQAAEMALSATREELQHGLIVPGTLSAYERLRTRSSALPMFQELAIDDERGVQSTTSREHPAAQLSSADRDFFIVQRDGSADSMYVSAPYISRASGQNAIALSLPWRSRDKTFKGILVAVISPTELVGAFEQSRPSSDAQLTIYREDGTVIASSNPQAAPWALALDGGGRPRRNATVARQVLRRGGQTYLAVNLALHDRPIMLVMTRDADHVLATWRDQALITATATALTLLALLALVVRAVRSEEIRRAMQAAVIAQQARTMQIFESTQEGFWDLTVPTDEMFLSPRMKELYGFGRDESIVMRKDFLGRARLHADDRQRQQQTLQAHIEGVTPEYDCTSRVQRADGQWRWIRARGAARRDGNGRALRVTGVAFDVTVEKEAQQQAEAMEKRLLQANRMESLGTLAGGIAHDFNNILAAIIGYGEMAAGNVPPGSALSRHLEQVLQAGQRGKALVDRILAFSRAGVRPSSSFKIQHIVEEVLQLLPGSLPPAVTVEKLLEAPQAEVNGNATLMFEAAMNLVTNALHAMPEGGTLKVELVKAEFAGPQLLSHGTAAPGIYAVLSVSDTGMGMSPETQERIFEPFFTTKGPQQGTGLGLAVVYGVVAELGGALDVRSAPGQGTRMSLYFPVRFLRAELTEDILGIHAEETPRGRGEVILVVDDERALVNLAEEMLAELGYEPVGFGSCRSALAEFRSNPARFDLVLTDQIMAEMTGIDLAREIRTLRPSIPIIIISGYGGALLPERAGAAGVNAVVSKPLNRDELARIIANALHDRAVFLSSLEPSARL